MATSRLLYKYTPGQASARELEATFVGRTALLEQLQERTRQWVAGAAPEHTLLVAARGMGKTHLLRLLYHRLQSARLPHLRVVLFPEESYTIGSADELILQVWARLPESAGQPAPSPSALGAAWVLDRLRAAGEREGARFLLLLDGFDLLLDQLREADERRLHQLLTTESHLCLVATAAAVPAAVAEHGRPLFRLLRLERLRPLEPVEAEELLRRRADLGGDEQALARWAELPPRIRAVAELAGGNPRLLLMLYQSLQAGELASVTRAFRALLDELTPFYKHVVEGRAPQQRKLLGLAAFHTRGASPTELAAESGLPERQVSALLGPLVKDGLLRRVRRPGTRASAYPFAEPLLRLWLQMRSSPEGERSVACIVEFYRVWYAGAAEEFRQAFAAQWQEAARWAREAEPAALREALLRLRYLAQAAPSLGAALDDAERLRELANAAATGPAGWEAVLASLDRALELQSDDASALANKGVVLVALGRREEAIAVFDQVAARYGGRPEAMVVVAVASALLNKGVLLAALGRREEAIAVYDQVLGRYGDRSEPALAGQVAWALFNKGVLLAALGRREEAIAVYDQIVGRYGDRSEPALAGQVAWALLKKGVALELLGQVEGAIAVYDQVVERYRGRPDWGAAAHALANRGAVLAALGRSEAAIAVYDQVEERYGGRPEAGVAAGVARALAAKAIALGAMGRLEEAIVVCDEVEGRYGDRPEAGVVEMVAHALVTKAVALGELGRAEQEIAVYDQVVERYVARPEVGVTAIVAGALANIAAALAALGRPEEAIVVCDQVVERYGRRPETGVAEMVARALGSKGTALGALGRLGEGIVAFEQALERSTVPLLAAAVARWLARVAASAAARDDRGLARRAMVALGQAIARAPAHGRDELLLESARTIFGSGHLELCREALGRLEPLSGEAELLEPYRQALAYLAGGRDPYFLDALNPDVRRAVELIAGEFGEGPQEQTPPSP